MPDENQTVMPLSYVKSAEELAELQGGDNSLKKNLTYTMIFILALSFIFDSSLFYIPQMGVELAGPSSIISWVILAFVAMYIALCFSELITLFPTSGGIYEICKITYGNFISFMAGWLTWLVGNIALTISIPAGLEVMYPDDTPTGYSIKFLLSATTIFLFSYFTKRGKNLSNRLFVYFTIITFLSFFVLITPMFIDIPALVQGGVIKTPLHFSYYTPFFVHEGIAANVSFIFVALFIITTVIFGLEAVSFLSGEVENPREVLPKIFPKAMGIVLGVSLIFVIGSIAVLDQGTYLNANIFYEELLKVTLHDWSKALIPIIVFFSGMVYFSEGLGWIIASPRLIFSIAKDKLFPTSFTKLDPQFQTPTRAIKFQQGTLFLFLFINYSIHIFSDEDPFILFHELFILLSLILASFLLMSIPLLRKKYPKMERPYKVPLGKTLPYLIVLIFIASVVFWAVYDHGLREVLIAFALIFLGIPTYFLLLFYFDPEVYSKIKKEFSFLNHIIEMFTLSRSVRDEIYDKVGFLNDKKVFEFGCGSGTLTMDLAKRTLPHGAVYATDLVEKSVNNVLKKAEKQGFKHLFAIYDPHQINRVHHAIPLVDVVISSHMLSHVQDLRKVIKEMYRRLPEGGRICFKDIRDILGVMPNVGWVSDPEKVVSILKEEGFIANSKIIKGIFWNNLYIYGIKTQENVPFV